MGYLMESENEAARLVIQAEADAVLPRLVGAGLSAGQSVLDAGCGPGVIAGAIADVVGPTGRVVAVDISKDRIAEATRRLSAHPNVSCVCADITRSGLPSETFDLVWSQFVLEYLPQPLGALDELKRVTKRGGKLVISDIDGVGVTNFPQPEIVERLTPRFLEAVGRVGFDLFVGRKIFHMCKSLGLRDVKVRVEPFFVAAGKAPERLLADWRTRFATLAPVVTPALGGEQIYNDFCTAYLGMLAAEDSLKYGLVLITEATRP